MPSQMSDDLRTGALVYHRGATATGARPGKLEIQATKPLGNQRDLALAYSPGVAAACEAIARRSEAGRTSYTTRQNLVAVLTNGTAVLGLGNIGPLAGKPVMEGKAVLFKKFAGIDVFDIEVAENDAKRLIEVVAALEPTFGGINLEDIKAPECFEVEEPLRARMGIPVFHDDQHGTAIIVGGRDRQRARARRQDARRGQDRDLGRGRGGARLPQPARHARREAREHLGHRHRGRRLRGPRDAHGPLEERSSRSRPRRGRWPRSSPGADVFLGLSAGGVLKPEMVSGDGREAADPGARQPDARDHAGRGAPGEPGRDDLHRPFGLSEPGQQRAVLSLHLPWSARRRRDRRSTRQMKAAAVRAIAALAREPPSDVVARAYGGVTRLFGPDSLIPSPFDPRLILRIAPAVARAAMESGVARRPIADFEAYEDKLDRFVFRSGFVMKPVFTARQGSAEARDLRRRRGRARRCAPRRS